MIGSLIRLDMVKPHCYPEEGLERICASSFCPRGRIGVVILAMGRYALYFLGVWNTCTSMAGVHMEIGNNVVRIFFLLFGTAEMAVNYHTLKNDADR